MRFDEFFHDSGVAAGVRCAVGMALLMVNVVLPAHAEDSADFFERHVRPVLVAKCIECHGDDDPEGGLRLTSRANVVKGGQSGPAALEKRPAESLLVQAIHQRGKLKMPPEEKLGDTEIASLTKWVELGLPWPDVDRVIGKPQAEFAITDTDRRHWSFRPIADPASPNVRNLQWSRTTS